MTLILVLLFAVAILMIYSAVKGKNPIEVIKTAIAETGA